MAAPSSTPTDNFGFTKFDFGFFGWDLLMNANWDQIDTFFKDVFDRLAAAEALAAAPAYSWNDQFFDIAGELAAVQVTVNDIPATRLLKTPPVGTNPAFGSFLVLPEGVSIISRVSVRLKISQPAPAAGFVRLSVDIRINGGPFLGAVIVDIDPVSTVADSHEVVELLQFNPYELQGEDDLLVVVKRLETQDTFPGDIDVYSVMATPQA